MADPYSLGVTSKALLLVGTAETSGFVSECRGIELLQTPLAA